MDPHRRMRLDNRWPVDWVYSSYCKFAESSYMKINGKEYSFKDYDVNYNYPYKSDINTVYDLQFSRFMTTQCLYLSDRLGMGNSVELRSPLVDYKLVEFISSLPVDMKYKSGKPKQYFKDILAQNIPDEILYGEKKGFTPPSQFISGLCGKYDYTYIQSECKFYNSILADRVIENLMTGNNRVE